MTAHQQHSKRWAALAVIALVQFIIVLDITVVNIALPHIQTSLDFSRAGLAWVVDGYVLTAGGLLLLGGRLADLLGRKRMFLIGVSVFAIASALSGAAVDSAMLVASRFLQGMGEAIATPAAFGLVALLFTDPKERATAIGINGGVAGLGGTLGPVISGLLISVASWRWIFYVNIPVAVIAILAVSRLVAESRASTRLRFGRAAAESGESADLAGAVLGTAGLVAIVYGFIAAANHPWGDGPGVGRPDGGGRGGRGVRGPGAHGLGATGACRFSPQPDPGDVKRRRCPVRQRVLHRVLPADPVLPAGPALLGHPDRPRPTCPSA